MTVKTPEQLRAAMKELGYPVEADWDSTNHFELCGRGADDIYDPWWLDLSDLSDTFGEDPCETTRGKLLGLVMDLAVWAAAKLREEAEKKSSPTP
jgi:hypothetical protein